MRQKIPTDLVQIMKKINLDQKSQLLHLGRINLGDHHLHMCPQMEAKELDPAKINGSKVGVVSKINRIVPHV
jgi:hypothetical protein